MAVTGKVRAVRTGEGIECHHCTDDATHSVEGCTGVFVYYCKDHFDDLKNGVMPKSEAITPTVSRPAVKSVLVEQITLF